MIYVLAGYMGSVSVVTTVKWFWFLIGLLGLGGVIIHFAQTFKVSADAKGGELAALYGKVAWLSILVWICYPVVWLFSEGFASFSVSFEVCAYSVLDIISKVVVCFMVMSGSEVPPPPSRVSTNCPATLSDFQVPRQKETTPINGKLASSDQATQSLSESIEESLADAPVVQLSE